MLSGPAGGICRPKRLFTKPMSICFGVQGASEMILGAKNMFSGCLTPVPLDRNQKNKFFNNEKQSEMFFFSKFWEIFGKIDQILKIEVLKF